MEIIAIIKLVYLVSTLFALFEIGHLEKHFKKVSPENSAFVTYMSMFTCVFLPMLNTYFGIKGLIRIFLLVFLGILKVLSYIVGKGE